MKHINSLRPATLGTALIIAISAIALPAIAQEEVLPPVAYPPSTYPTPDEGDTLKRADQRFLNKAANLGADEVTLAQIAADRAIHPAVRDLATMIAKEHATAKDELAAIATRKGVRLESDESASRNLTRKWMDKKGDDFDADYLKATRSGHKDAIDIFESAVKSSDPEISSFAAKFLPTLNAHLTRIESVQKLLD